MTKNHYPQQPVLMIDDEPSWLQSCKLLLEYEANISNVKFCSDSRQALDRLNKESFSLVLLDLTMPYINGQELLVEIKQKHPGIEVIILSGLNQIQTAVECMKIGAYDYFVKTDEKERLVSAIRRVLEMRNLQQENMMLRKSILQTDDVVKPNVFDEIVTQSPKMKAVFSYVEAVAGSSEPILLVGESGAGKELFARAIHDLSRPGHEFVTFNVAGIDDNVFSDTLFGHKKGAYTGAMEERPGLIARAGHGTILLDEIGDLSLSSQVKLLRLLQDGEYYQLGSDTPKYSNVRFICATNQNIAEKQKSGDFRKDLFFRLNTHLVQIPPLRERPEDIELLLAHFVYKAAQDMKKNVSEIPQELLFILANYEFPGNVRELRAMIYDAVSQHKTGKLSMVAFENKLGIFGNDSELLSASSGSNTKKIFQGSFPLPTLKEAGELLVEEAMNRSGKNQTIASGMLGITRQALGKRLRKRQGV